MWEMLRISRFYLTDISAYAEITNKEKPVADAIAFIEKQRRQ